MSCLTNFAMVWTITMIGLAYYTYTPLPSHAKEPLKQRFTAASVRAIKDLARPLVFGSEVNFTRTLISFNQYLSREEDDGTIEIDDELFDGVKVRVYTPITAKRNSQGLIYIHGGGWALLSVDAYDAFCRQLVKASNIVLVSVEYRLSPEHTYPTPLDDCVKATRYFLENADKYAVDPERVGIAGDSAGGNLAMSTSLRLTNDQTFPKRLKLTALIYPLLQAFDMNLPSYVENDQYRGPSFSTKNTLIFYIQLYAFGKLLMTEEFRNNSHIPQNVRARYSEYVNEDFLPEKYRSKSKPKDATSKVKLEEVEMLLDPFFSPLLATDEMLKKLPPTYVMTCDFDALRDDGMLLAGRLKKLGHEVTHVHMEGLEHGFVLLHFYDNAKSYVSDFGKYLTNNL